MSRGGLVRRYPVLAVRDFRLLLGDRLIAPASVGKSSGSLYSNSAGTFTYSANAPLFISPVNARFSQMLYSPCLQYQQVPQCWQASAVTRSPTAKPISRATRSTIP